MNWKDDGQRIVFLPDDFNFEECLVYLNRNPNEILHVVDRQQATITKALKLQQGPIVFQLQTEGDQLIVSFPMGSPDEETRNATALFVREWLDLDRNLEPFYQTAAKDSILKNVVPLYKGLRIVGVSDLFEALCWAIMGQQVSLHVAYLLKKRFVETFGESVTLGNQQYWMFPEAQIIANLSMQDLIPLKFTQRKAEYVLNVAKLMAEGQLSKERLQQYTDIAELEKHLTEIRGIGSWSANYVIMRCLRHPDAFPIADVGLHNALKQVLQRKEKPTMQEIAGWSEKWGHWKAYATFYLWRALME